MNNKNSTLKDFLMTLAATTVSIVLTFGTTAIVDRNKQRSAKRDMVVMILYDMQSTFRQCQQIMKIRDQELEKYSQERQKLQEMARSELKDGMSQKHIQEMQERVTRLQEAREAGKKESSAR